MNILTLNGGSSTIRFAIFGEGSPFVRRLSGRVDRIGLSRPTLSVRDGHREVQVRSDIDASTEPVAARSLVEWFTDQPAFEGIEFVGHRIVSGAKHTQPEWVTSELLDDLRHASVDDPAHLPGEIALIEAVQARYPHLKQLVCFDTTFHAAMPVVACQLAIPRRYWDSGVRRHGFHGISYSYLMEELRRLNDPAASVGRVILAHLGSGASLAAVRNGVSQDTSMGLTPASGLVMSSRSGDLDPGLPGLLARTEDMTPLQFQHMVHHDSGLLGISETSPDMRELLAVESHDVRAHEAVELFCYQARKWIGAFAAVLGGVDTLVFTGGIGENAPEIRNRICSGLEFLGIKLDSALNQPSRGLISVPGGRVAVRVIAADEEQMIARTVLRQVKGGPCESPLPGNGT
jgi:acetate kinase